jgi:hypothetical protein
MKTVLFVILILFGSILTAENNNQRISETTCITADNAKFAIVEMSILKEYTVVYSLNQWSDFNNSETNDLLYRVFFSDKDPKTGQKLIKCLALLPFEKIPKKIEDVQWNISKVYSKVNKKIINDPVRYKKAMEEWRKEFEKHLSQCATEYNDIEPEYLLSLKFFNKILQSKEKDAYKEKLLDIFMMFCGMQDVRNAIPLNKKEFNIDKEEYADSLPEPIRLPKVKVDKNNAKISNYPLAAMIPRSCYYMEFPNALTMIKSIEFTSHTLDKWSAGTYPKTLADTIFTKLSKLGFSKIILSENSDKLGKVAIAGWDPFYFSGTSLMIVTEHAIEIKAPLQFSRDNVLAVSDSEKMISMAKKAYKNSKSLFNDSNFIAAYKKLKKSNDEKFFLYLSDYWLTNFVSPRWMILSRRIAECDARIRLTEILRLAEKKEKSLDKLPSVKNLQEKYIKNKKLLWIMRDLIVDNESGNVISTALGGLYNHKTIDSIPFKQVTKAEKSYYKDFTDFYSRNWKQMDPLAFTVSSKNSDVWLNLYISPISKLSNFRELKNIVLPTKIRHTMKDIPESAFGLSVMFQTTLLRPLAGKIAKTLPQTLQISLRGMDMAPHIDALQYLLDPARKQDTWSFSRMPIMLEVPTLILNAALGMSRQNLQDSKYQGLQEVAIDNSWLYNIFIKSEQDGYTRSSLNPNALLAMTDTKETQTIESELPSDIYMYANFVKGYTLHRFLAMLAAKNRIYAAWTRVNRDKRIESYFKEELNQGVFPKADPAFQYAAERVPSKEYKDLFHKERNYSNGFWGIFNSDSNISKMIPKLPLIIPALKKLETYISVEENSLQFITHLKIDKSTLFPEEHKVRKNEQRNPVAEESNESEELDFDAE